ncbi:MAG: hypothetical protein ACOC0P_06055, partial [Planctomycetota bacterium]
MVTAAQRERHLEWLTELTGIPTAAGREHRVVRWVNDWLSRRKNLSVKRDRHGNMLIRIRNSRGPTVLFTAHLDHPAFVVRDIIDKRHLRCEFRGGVRDAYFENGRVLVHDAGEGVHRG